MEKNFQEMEKTLKRRLIMQDSWKTSQSTITLEDFREIGIKDGWKYVPTVQELGPPYFKTVEIPEKNLLLSIVTDKTLYASNHSVEQLSGEVRKWEKGQRMTVKRKAPWQAVYKMKTQIIQEYRQERELKKAKKNEDNHEPEDMVLETSDEESESDPQGDALSLHESERMKEGSVEVMEDQEENQEDEKKQEKKDDKKKGKDNDKDKDVNDEVEEEEDEDETEDEDGEEEWEEEEWEEEEEEEEDDEEWEEDEEDEEDEDEEEEDEEDEDEEEEDEEEEEEEDDEDEESVEEVPSLVANDEVQVIVPEVTITIRDHDWITFPNLEHILHPEVITLSDDETNPAPNAQIVDPEVVEPEPVPEGNASLVSLSGDELYVYEPEVVQITISDDESDP